MGHSKRENFYGFIAAKKFFEEFEKTEREKPEFGNESGHGYARGSHSLENDGEPDADHEDIESAIELRGMNGRDVLYVVAPKGKSPRQIRRGSVVNAVEERADISKEHADEN